MGQNFSAKASLLLLIRGLCLIYFTVIPTKYSLGQLLNEKETVAGRQKLALQVTAVESDALRANLRFLAQHNNANSDIVRWYDGEIRQGNTWCSLEAAHKLAAQNLTLAEYKNRRNQIADRSAAHEKLARWCQKNRLPDQAYVHWLLVLRNKPEHRAALNELGLKWHQGQLIAKEEIELVKKREREFQEEKKRWKAEVSQLRKAIEQNDPAKQRAAREKIRNIQEPAAVPALLEEFAEKDKTEEKTIKRQIELLHALSGINDPVAINALLTFALGSPHESVRYAAVDQLKSKAYHEYIPTLLSQLELPVDASVSIQEIGNRIVSTYNYEQEGPGNKTYERSQQSYRVIPGYRYNLKSEYLVEYVPARKLRDAYDIPEKYYPGQIYNQCGRVNFVPPHYQPARHVPALYSSSGYKRTYLGDYYEKNPQYIRNRNLVSQGSAQKAETVQRQVQVTNQEILQNNERIVGLLTEVTGKTLDTYPKSWWNWWSDYLDQNPDIATSGARQQLNMTLLNHESRGLARGTWVWTLSGKESIETIRPGDYVLSQNAATGELAFKVVLLVNSLPTIAVSQYSFPKGTLHSTPGHVVWASGAGWQRTGKVQFDTSLHGVYSEMQLIEVGEEFHIDCYDLVVADNHTYFAGDVGILVHDATPVKPTYEALPGFSPAVVADAIRLATLNN